MAQAGTVLIAVHDGTLADSLRFSLELEGYATRFCDEQAVVPLLRQPSGEGTCLVLDQDVFSRFWERRPAVYLGNPSIPAVLMVSQKTDRLLAKARIGGVAKVLEKPILGGVMVETVRQLIEKSEVSQGTSAYNAFRTA